MIQDNYQKDFSQKISNLKKLKQTQSRFLKWNNQASKWQQVQPVKYVEAHITEHLHTLSFNVLFDKLYKLNKKGCMEHVLNSKQRFAYILQRIGIMQPDIVGLQQVTPCFFDMLLQCQWARSKYWISNFRKHNMSFGNMLITKIKPICIEGLKIKRLPRVVQTGFFGLKSNKNSQASIVTFSSVHLIALDSNHNIRIQQMHNLVLQIKRYQQIVDDFVLQGDMNFHAQWQTQTATKYNFKDMWLDKYENNLKDYPGFTFDSSYNSLINQIYWGFQRRRMRLDRIFYLGNALQVENIQVVMDKPIHKQKENVSNHMFLKGGFLYVADYFGWNVRQNKQEFLYPSDHFALLAKLKIKQKVVKSIQLKI